MKLLVCGGRDYRNSDLICKILDSYLNDYPDSLSIIEGGAYGADHIAFQWATRNHVPVTTVPAGPVRNQRMIDMKPDVVLAFPSGTSRSTYDTINRATHAAILTYVYAPRS